MDQCELSGTRVLVRVDHNVPCTVEGEIRDDGRIVRSLETLRELVSKRARIVVLSHFGYPEGNVVSHLSTRILAERLGLLLNHRVQHCEELSLNRAKEHVENVAPGEILYLENSRFWEGEQTDSKSLAEAWAEFGDIYINEAFSACHRRHASIHRLSRLLPAFAGRRLEQERRELLSQRDEKVARGIILGGAKLDQKLKAIAELNGPLSVLCLGGLTSIAVAKAQGKPTGTTEFSSSRMEIVEAACDALFEKGIQPQLPIDWIVHASDGTERIANWNAVAAKDTIVDVGPETVQRFLAQLRSVSSVFWNGPLGIYEKAPGERGSVAMADGLAQRVRHGTQVVLGGGDTLALVSSARLSDSFSYCSSGGGAALEFIARGDDLPGLVHLFGGH
ncbi:phosphoglycerate kinase [Stieleria sp. ICT_E10.1]|uniref:phosphoglycerate kinase n=1 Tax=Stieleria sedimenti TaxID=2976331 RepID=UPI00217FF66E|nr:phosphoglycerate kinase [Stieleria sedimenti]MCS7468878.1 phosphoglycerate kinase [Stieleria sedimenti]